MLYVKCYKEGCKTPYFCIPDPNTKTVIVYADNPDTTADGSSLSGNGEASGGAMQTNRLSEDEKIDRTSFLKGFKEALKEEVTKNGIENLDKLVEEFMGFEETNVTTENASTPFQGLMEVNDTDYDDYLVVYCDSGHKNYVPFNNIKK